MKSFQFIFLLVFFIFIFFDYLNSPNIKIKKNSISENSINCAPCGAPCEIIIK